MDLVEAGGEAFGESAGVGEDERGALGVDEIDETLLDVGPDRGALFRARGCAREVAGDLAESRHVLDRDDDLQVPLLAGRGRHGRHRSTAGEVPGDLLEGAHRGGEADALGRGRQEGVEPVESDREVGAPLGPREGVDLVDDHRLHPREGLARLGGEHEEQRLGGGDEDVAGAPGEGATFVGGGVAGAHGDRDVGLGETEAPCRVPDSDEGGAEVAFDVDREGLEWGDVEHPTPLPGVAIGLGRRVGCEPVERPEERRERLAGTRGRDHESVVAAADRPPRPGLGGGGFAERGREPFPRRRREPREHVGIPRGVGGLGAGEGGLVHLRHSVPPGSDNPSVRASPDPPAVHAGTGAGGRPGPRVLDSLG